MASHIIRTMKLLHKVSLYRSDIERTGGGYVSKTKAERCNYLIKEAALLLGRGARHPEEVAVEETAGFPDGAADKSEVLMKVSLLREMLKNASLPAFCEPVRQEAEKDRFAQ